MKSETISLKRHVIQHLTYKDWCKKEKLPQEECSMAIYKHWKRSIPRLQRIIDNIANGHLDKANKDLGRYITAFRPERFTSGIVQGGGE